MSSGQYKSSSLIQPLKEIKEAEKFVKDNPDVIFTKADKGHVTVAMKRDEYDNKVNELLQDRDTYLPRSDDKVKKLYKKGSQISKELGIK